MLARSGPIDCARKPNPSARRADTPPLVALDRDKLTWSAPVVSGGRLFIRNENALVALDLTGKEK